MPKMPQQSCPARLSPDTFLVENFISIQFALWQLQLGIYGFRRAGNSDLEANQKNENADDE